MNLLALTRYGNLAASSRLRIGQYVPRLAAEGHAVRISPLLDNDALLHFYRTGQHSPPMLARDYRKRIGECIHLQGVDAIWLEKELLPWCPAFLECRLLRGRPYVVDYDDATFHNYDLHPNPLLRRMFRRKIDSVMRNAALVVAGNEYLAGRATAAGARRVEVLPTVVDLARYTAVKGVRQSNTFTVGWIGSPSTTRYLHSLEEVFRTLAKESPFQLRLIGAAPFHPGGVPVISVPWQEATEANELQAMDVGIMPLDHSPWELGKCGCKLIQYMACGLPVVASPVGMNPTLVQQGANGWLAATPAEWLAALRSLRDSPDMRAHMGRAGRMQVEVRYQLDVTAPKLLKWLDGLQDACRT